MSEAKINKCLTCGGDLAPDSRGIPTCQYCGRQYKDAAGGFSGELQEIVHRRQLREFIQAEELCAELQRKQPESSEVYWQTLLASLGVVYVQEENKAKPTFFSYAYNDRDEIKDNPNYKNALKYAKTEEERAYYQEQAKVLDALLKEFFNLVAKEASYDVFISFKRTTAATVNGEVRQIETDDCKKAEEIYKYFNKKYKVFFSPVSIGKDTGIVGEKYEPRILKALQTSQVMILLGSRIEYLEAQWVQNEWRRYQYFINKGKKNKASLILGYEKYMPPLPAALKDIQLDSFDWYSGGYLKELEKKLEPLVKSSKGFMSKLTQKKSTSEYFESDEGEFNSGYNADRITFSSKGKNIAIKIPANEKRDMQTAENSQLKGKFKDAITRYSAILKLNPENAEAYWKRFCCKLGVRNDGDVPKSIPNARTDYYADIDNAVQKTDDEKFYWHVIDTLISSYSITSTSWKQLEILSNCLIKYIDESRSKNVLSYLENQYRYYINNGNIKTAEEVFASSRKLFFDANIDYNIGYMKNYAVCLFKRGEYALARKYFEEMAGARKDAEVYLYLLKCRVKTQNIETTKFKLKIDPSDDPSAKKPSELDLDEIIERIILCKPSEEIYETLSAIVMYQIAHNRKNAGDFIVTIASCIKNNSTEEEAKSNTNLINFLSAVANRFIQVKDFKSAKLYYTEILNVNPNYSRAHYGLLKCRLKAFDDYDLIKNKKSLQSYEEYNNALNCSTNEEYEEYIAIYNAQDERNTKNRERTNRKVWLSLTKGKRAIKRLVTSLCIIAVGIFGVYSYFGITSPVYYSAGDLTVIKGKSMFFNMLVDELEIDEHGGHGITEVGEGAFKNSSLKTLTLASSVTVIGDSAFMNNKKLTSVVAQSPDISLGKNAFKDCELLETFTIDAVSGSKARASAETDVNGIVIGEGAFENCKSLKTLKLLNCTAIGKNAFSGCENLTEITLDISSAKNVEDGAFDGTAENLKVYVPTVEEKALADLKKINSKVNFLTYTRNNVEECIYFINKIGTVTLSSKADIDNAQKLYDNLTSSEKYNVSNLSVLKSADEVYKTLKLINDIGTVTVDSESKIISAENAYKLLSENQKKLITNYSTLVSARTAIQPMLVDKMIAGIGNVTLDKEAKIIEVEEAYASLTAVQKNSVTKYNSLTSARTELDNLRVEDTVTKIEAIGTVELVSGTAIEIAEAAYANLSFDLQSRITNYTVLTDARKVFDVMTVIENIGTVNIDSLPLITKAEEAYKELTEALQAQVSNYSTIAEKRAVYFLATAIENLGTVYLGKGENYQYRTVTAESMSALSNSTVCNEITSITVSGIKSITKSNWKEVLPNLDTVRYDASKSSAVNSFKLDSSFAYHIIGSSTKNYGTSFTASSGEVLNLRLENFSFGSLSALNIDKVFITFAGSCTISSSGSAIVAKDLTLTMESGTQVSVFASMKSGISADNLTVTDVASPSDPAAMFVYGGSSSAGITADSITVNMKGALTVNGGNGVKGASGADGAKGYNGSIGNQGGIGGTGIVTDELVVRSGVVKVYGGKGGKGGTGGVGGEGLTGADGTKGSKSSGHGKTGGKGFTGGKGGTGGTGGTALECKNVIADVTVYLYGGEGGDAGTGGKGGKGGTGGNGAIEKGFAGWAQYTWNGGDGGEGGTGGNSGERGSGGIACSTTFINVEGVSGSRGGSGYGGAGGAGGAGGKPGERRGSGLGESNHVGKYGNTGADGASGN